MHATTPTEPNKSLELVLLLAAMPDFLVRAATGALGPVLDKLAALLSDEYKRFKGVRGEVKFLIRELEAMHAFLLKKSEGEDPDVQDKAWMKEVRELSYDIEDSLDEFRIRIHEESTKPDGFIDKCKNLLAKTKARRQIAKAIQDLKVQVKEVSERNARYKMCETVMNTSKVTVDPRALAIFEDASRLVGIDKAKQELISFLTKDDGGISSQQPKIVSIVGIGGIGKTTLANRVYEELKNQFQCRAFLSVSRNPDMVKILRTILSKVTGRPYHMTEAGSIQQLIMEINEFLRTKRRWQLKPAAFPLRR
ncbi:disease resistance protein PIK6-NP-like isoform X2 [Miscanthus floridulus]|uniref:disease resistance protein PIK6-NP-like isoform X2 n=1 Tax=Miscanthus floridulus TaxID=154761 RepID=UPI00345A8666